MKKIVLTSLAALLLATSANAGVYVSGHLGTGVNTNVDIFDSVTVIGSIGYAFDNGLRLETDIYAGTLVNMTNNSNTFSASINANGTFGIRQLKALYDFKIGGKFTPYVGLGLTQLAYVSTKVVDGFIANGSFIGGVSYALNSKLSLDLQYNRIFAYEYAFNKDDGSSVSSGSSLWKAGLSYKF
ncbi:MAG: porin family protein [Rickettsiales bacterium]|nr:porin family protein [Rickettsiales bacterium]